MSASRSGPRKERGGGRNTMAAGGQAVEGSTQAGSGRTNQKERTRRAIVRAAVQLIQAGRLPSVADAATEALVSPATAYRYFPDQLTLLSAALGDGIVGMAADFRPSIRDGAGAVERVDLAATEFLARMLDREPLIRAVIALSLLRSVDGVTSRADAVAVRPGFRLAWIDEALRPVAGQLDALALRRLKLALGVAMGPEALVALQDTMGADADEAVAVCRWVARTLTEAVIPRPPPVPPRNRPPEPT